MISLKSMKQKCTISYGPLNLPPALVSVSVLI